MKLVRRGIRGDGVRRESHYKKDNKKRLFPGKRTLGKRQKLEQGIGAQGLKIRAERIPSG